MHHHLLAENERHADGIRRLLREQGVFAVNLMSSPGRGQDRPAGSDAVPAGRRARAAVIEGDIETSADADRLRPFPVPVVQINTGPFGGDCHLPAPLVAEAMEKLDLRRLDLLFIENVGNLVCPAEFDIGEARKVVLLSVTEGEDKPLKYPLMFHEAGLALVTKIDLLPHLDFDLRPSRRISAGSTPARPSSRYPPRRARGWTPGSTGCGRRSPPNGSPPK